MNNSENLPNMAALLLLFIIIGIFVLFIVPEFRRALFAKGTLLLIAFIAVALLSFGAGHLNHYNISRSKPYRIEPRLKSAIQFIESQRIQKGSVPTSQTFQEWQKDKGNWFSYDQNPGTEHYTIRVWNGDEYQVYNSETSQFYFER